MTKSLKFGRKQVLSVAVAVVAVLGISTAVGAWSPDRPTYTVAHPADHVTFNSITDNPNYGDERAFFDVKPATNTAQGGYVDKIKVADGEELVVRTYVHNNAADNLNGTNFNGVGVAKNTKLRIYLPTATASTLRANSYVSADNASPKEVADTVDFYGDSAFSLEYVTGSAVAFNNAHPTGMKISDTVVGTGAPLGYTSANGVFPGCFQYVNIVTVKVKVHMKKTPSFTVQKKVALPGDSSWSEDVTTQPGKAVNYQVTFTNTGNTQLDNVIIRDQLPKGMSIVPGSTKIFNANNPNGVAAGTDAVVANGGIVIGTYQAGANGFVQFKATTPTIDNLACGDNKLVNTAEARVGSSAASDTANVKVNKTCTKPETPIFTCDNLVISQDNQSRKVTATVAVTALNGAVYKTTSFDFGTTPSTVVVTDKTTAEHTYTADGTYIITATPSFMVNGKLVTASSDACVQKVTFENGKPPVTPPTEIPNTGAGSTVGLFVGSVLVSAAAYRLWIIRKLS